MYLITSIRVKLIFTPIVIYVEADAHRDRSFQTQNDDIKSWYVFSEQLKWEKA